MRVVLSMPDAEYEEILFYARGKKFINVKPAESVKMFILHATGQAMKKNPLGRAEAVMVEKIYGTASQNAVAAEQSGTEGILPKENDDD